MESHKPERDEADKTSLRSNDDKPEKAPMPKARARLERVSVFKDYLRVFTYTTKLDFALMVVAGIACIGAGVVRFSLFCSSRCFSPIIVLIANLELDSTAS